MDSYLETTKFIFLFIAYILCFIFLEKTNTEYICYILFLVLHIFLLTLFISSGMAKGIGNMITVIPFNILMWDGKVPINIIFILGWALLFVATSILINTYRVLHKAFSSIDKPIDLGDFKNYTIKEHLKIFMIVSTILLWVLFTFNVINTDYVNFSNKKSRISYIIDQFIKAKNNILIFVSFGTLVLSSSSVFLSQQLSINTMTITTQPN